MSFLDKGGQTHRLSRALVPSLCFPVGEIGPGWELACPRLPCEPVGLVAGTEVSPLSPEFLSTHCRQSPSLSRTRYSHAFGASDAMVSLPRFSTEASRGEWYWVQESFVQVEGRQPLKETCTLPILLGVPMMGKGRTETKTPVENRSFPPHCPRDGLVDGRGPLACSLE